MPCPCSRLCDTPVTLRQKSHLYCGPWACPWNPFLTHPTPFAHILHPGHHSHLLPSSCCPELVPAPGSRHMLVPLPELRLPNSPHPRTPDYSALGSKSRCSSVRPLVYFISRTFALGRNFVSSFMHAYPLSPQLEITSLKAGVLLISSTLFRKQVLNDKN